MNKNKFFSILILIFMMIVGVFFYYLKYIPYQNKKIKEQEIQKQKELEEAKAPKFIKQDIQKIELTNAQKIDELRDKKNYYKVIKLSNYSKAYFKKENDNLLLSYLWNKVWNFDFVSENDLNVMLIEWTDTSLFIKVWENKYYYDSNTNQINKIDLNIAVKYVKVWQEDSLLIVTEKGTFIYNKYKNELDYFSYFNDFVYYKDWYIWIVNQGEDRIFRNLWYTEEKQNLIVYYNPKTKHKEIRKKTDEIIKKIFIFWWSIFIKTGNDKLFKIENI